eukprot:91428-Amphidinium_carterae.1
MEKTQNGKRPFLKEKSLTLRAFFLPYKWTVEDRPDKYGKEGPYHYLTGHDITWGLVSGQDSEETVNLFYDLFKSDE